MGLYYKTSKTSKLAYDYTNTDGSISGKNIYTPNVLAYGDNQKLSDTVYYVDDPNYANAQITVTVTGKKTNTATFTHKDVKYDFYLRGEQQEDGTYAKEAVPFITAYYLRGAYSYHDMDDFVAATKNLASFSGGLTGGNCWTVGSDGTLTWGIL